MFRLSTDCDVWPSPDFTDSNPTSATTVNVIRGTPRKTRDCDDWPNIDPVSSFLRISTNGRRLICLFMPRNMFKPNSPLSITRGVQGLYTCTSHWQWRISSWRWEDLVETNVLLYCSQFTDCLFSPQASVFFCTCAHRLCDYTAHRKYTSPATFTHTATAIHNTYASNYSSDNERRPYAIIYRNFSWC